MECKWVALRSTLKRDRNVRPQWKRAVGPDERALTRQVHGSREEHEVMLRRVKLELDRDAGPRSGPAIVLRGVRHEHIHLHPYTIPGSLEKEAITLEKSSSAVF